MIKLLHAFIIIILFMFAASPVFGETEAGFLPATNDTATPANVMAEIQDVKFVVGQWEDFAKIVKKSGFSSAIVPTLVFLIMLSLVIFAVCFNIILNFVKIFTPEKTDEKIDKIEKWVENYLIRYPYIVIKKLRGIVKKK